MNFWLKSKSSTLPKFSLVLQVGRGWLPHSAYDRKPQIGFASIWPRYLPQLHLQMFHGGLRYGGGVNRAWCVSDRGECVHPHARESWGWACPSLFLYKGAADSLRLRWAEGKCFRNHKREASPSSLRECLEAIFFFFSKLPGFPPNISNISMTFTNSPACFLISRALH